MAFDKEKDNSVNPINNKNLSQPNKKCNIKRQQNNKIIKHKEGVQVGKRVDDSSWSLSADEDYIVFSFRENGAFDCKGIRSESHRCVDGKHKNSRPANRKLEYGDDTEQVSDQNIHEKGSNANMQDIHKHGQDYVTPFKQDEEKETIYLSRNPQRERIRRACQIEEIDDDEDHGMVSAESRDSNQSEGSTDSFAFPVIGWEWIGSPARMPKSDDLHLRKQKIRSLRFQCCRF